ncbi:MliC family protein [Ruegeria pomeroyi]|nr:MliC family protein [Ruegeria pomeroyi]
MRACFTLCLLLAAPAFAQEGPSFDCSKAQSDVETLICEDADLARLDRLVAERYTAALAVIDGLDTGAEQAKQSLRAEQRGWIKGRDECWKAGDLRICIADTYLRREGELVARWMLEEPTGIAFWACGGNPANEVVTYFYATELPSVRFERGDSIDTGTLVPTGSGAKYEGSFGRSIWTKGDSALYRDPDPDGSEWDCVLTSNG